MKIKGAILCVLLSCGDLCGVFGGTKSCTCIGKGIFCCMLQGRLGEKMKVKRYVSPLKHAGLRHFEADLLRAAVAQERNGLPRRNPLLER